MSDPAHAIQFDGSRFWVVHRRVTYGPFDYEWALDLEGIELTYQGTKYGEVATDGSFAADMREFTLPIRVVHVASLTAGCVVFGIFNGVPEEARLNLVRTMLKQYGWERFEVCQIDEHP